jgi:hypothetical protein
MTSKTGVAVGVTGVSVGDGVMVLVGGMGVWVAVGEGMIVSVGLAASVKAMAVWIVFVDGVQALRKMIRKNTNIFFM